MDGTEQDRRVLVFAPIGRDGPASAELLRSLKLDTLVCPDLAALVREIERGAGAVFIAEEGLFGQDTAPLTQWVERQPAWSDLPFIVLTSHQEQPAVVAWRLNLIDVLRNVSLLERPVQPITLASAARSSLRARRRQYEVRALIRAREQAAQQLEGLVVERTRALAEANQQLRAEMEERTRIEETLRQAQRIEAIGQLTGGIAHDFNNLLMVITAGLEMLERQDEPARRRRLMDGMVHAARRGAALTRQLLAFSRRQDIRSESVDIARQIDGMRELLDRSLGGQVQVELDLPPTLWPIEVDPGQFELVLLNLVVNARDAMPKGGTIVLRGENLPGFSGEGLAGDYVRLAVIDTGTGMSPEVQARVFEPYFTTKDVGKGSGLGLAQVYGFAKQSRGTVRIESQPGHGTSVALYLPKSDRLPAGDQPNLTSAQAPQRRNRTAGGVLLVEDDDEVAALTGEMLEELGYEVIRVASAMAGLGALADRRKVDIVLSDVMMPGGMNGLEMAREMRRRHPGLPVLLTSGYAASIAQDARAEGIALLPKPYRMEQLAEALKTALSGWHGHRAAANGGSA